MINDPSESEETKKNKQKALELISNRTISKDLLSQVNKYIILFIIQFWKQISGSNKEKENYPDYYKNILNDYLDTIPSKHKEIIEKDLSRTFPDDEYFKNIDNINKLRNILIAYSRRNDSVGYCQGFNFIVGRILEIIDNEVIYNI